MKARWQSHSTFVEIAQEHFEHLLECESKLADLEEKLTSAASPDKTQEIQHEMVGIANECTKHSMITIVFSAMALEAFIYDYAAWRLGDTFVKKHLDNLTPVSKWVVIPRLITGKELPRDGQAFNLLKNLIRERNKLIHYKSSIYHPPPDDIQDRLKRGTQISQRAKDAISVLETLAQELESIDPVSWAPLLKPDSYRL